MPEGVGDVAHHHALSKKLADILSDQQVSHESFRRYQEFVRQDIPRSNQDALLLDVFLQSRQICHANLQVVLEHDCLPVKHEKPVIRIVIQDDQEIIHKVDELQAELLEGFIPFAIPVSMRNNMQSLHKLS